MKKTPTKGEFNMKAIFGFLGASLLAANFLTAAPLIGKCPCQGDKHFSAQTSMDGDCNYKCKKCRG